MTRFWWRRLPLLCLLAPMTARADGIDLPVALGFGIGIFVPLLAFNATIEAPIVARFLGVRFRDLWVPWFKANVWSLFSGIPVLFVTAALQDWLVPGELGARVRVYPAFLIGCILLYLAATILVELLYARRWVRKTGVPAVGARLLRSVAWANLASYAVLGPAFFALNYPRSEIREFTPNAAWASQPNLTVLSVNELGHLQALDLNGQNQRVVVPHPVRDYVVSSDLTTALYRGEEDRFFLFRMGTNSALPVLGFRCIAPKMDFSPSGRYAAFFHDDSHKVRVFDSASGQFTDVPTFGKGSTGTLAWSSKEDFFYLRIAKEYWGITVGPPAVYRQLTNAPTDFAGHSGEVGTAWGWDGASYYHHQLGELRLMVLRGIGSRLIISRDRERFMEVRDPAGGLGVREATFLNDREIFVELGGYIYLLDIATKRVGPIVRGERAIYFGEPYAKRLDY